jgi:hypothetical protein
VGVDSTTGAGGTSGSFAKLSALTGAADPAWNLQPDGPVNALMLDAVSNDIYVGGSFSSIAGRSRRSIAAFNPDEIFSDDFDQQ